MSPLILTIDGILSEEKIFGYQFQYPISYIILLF